MKRSIIVMSIHSKLLFELGSLDPDSTVKDKKYSQ